MGMIRANRCMSGCSIVCQRARRVGAFHFGFFVLFLSLRSNTASRSQTDRAASLVDPGIPSYCDERRDDIRFFGSGGDAGRVELCVDGTWRYVCVGTHDEAERTNDATSTRSITTAAAVACRQLGYQSAFMGNLASAMAFGETVDSGVVNHGTVIAHCRGTEATLRDCPQVHHDEPACTVHRAMGAACSTAAVNTAASTYPNSIERHVQGVMQDMAEWYANDQARRRQQQDVDTNAVVVDLKDTCTATATAIATTSEQRQCTTATLPTPFQDCLAIQEAYVFPDYVTKIYQKMQTEFNKTLVAVQTLLQQEEEKSRPLSFSDIRWNALGVDLKNFFPPPMTLEQVRYILHSSRVLQIVRDLYLSANQHNAIHWFLDAPYRYYSQPNRRDDDDNVSKHRRPSLDPSAQSLFDTLQRDGIVVVEDFGADIDGIVHLAEAALTGDALYRKNETSIAGGGSIQTSRRPIPLLDDLLIRNETVASVIHAYLGPSILHGYKVTRLTKGLTTTDQYNAGMYHHDRVGRRLKFFLFLHDVDCEMGHPTRVAAGSHNILYYKSEDYPITRFNDEFVERNYEIVKGCGKRGGGFLFDTHTLHKGTVQGDRERTVVIAEYHHIAKCAYSKEYDLGIPCPGGDLYRSDTPVAAI